MTADALSYKRASASEWRFGWNPKLAQHELKLKVHEETVKDNASRRRRENVGFHTILGVVVGGLVLTLGIGVWSENAETRHWAQGGFTLILGSLLGALAGYFTGKNSK